MREWNEHSPSGSGSNWWPRRHGPRWTRTATQRLWRYGMRCGELLESGMRTEMDSYGLKDSQEWNAWPPQLWPFSMLLPGKQVSQKTEMSRQAWTRKMKLKSLKYWWSVHWDVYEMLFPTKWCVYEESKVLDFKFQNIFWFKWHLGIHKKQQTVQE